CLWFQAEGGIRDWSVTGVQTCALPICPVPEFAPWCEGKRPVSRTSRSEAACPPTAPRANSGTGPSSRRCTGCVSRGDTAAPGAKVGRASCRERVEGQLVAVVVHKSKRQ